MSGMTIMPPPDPPDGSGEDLLNDMLDLLVTRLPALPFDDPVRQRLAPMVPQLAAALGRPAVRRV